MERSESVNWGRNNIGEFCVSYTSTEVSVLMIVSVDHVAKRYDDGLIMLLIAMVKIRKTYGGCVLPFTVVLSLKSHNNL
jgi:hypothetical protein